jgi:hypothetical protein
MSDDQSKQADLPGTGNTITGLGTAGILTMTGAGAASHTFYGGAPHGDAPAEAEASRLAEAEASRILERIERELPSVEERTARLMYHYGL